MKDVIILYFKHPRACEPKAKIQIVCFIHAVEWAGKGYVVTSQLYKKKKGDPLPICGHCRRVIG